MPPTPHDLNRELKRLLDITGSGDFDEVSRRALDWLAGIVRYDLATLFLLDDDELVAIVSRGPLAVDGRLRSHRLPLQRFPSIRESLEMRRARTFTEHDHAHGEGDPYDGVLDLPHGHACMVVPLFAREETLGLITLDRSVCEPYSGAVVSLVEVYAQLLSVALDRSRQVTALSDLQRRMELAARESGARVADPSAILVHSRAPLVMELTQRARVVSETDTPVLILGETGTGKEQLARTIHAWSSRRHQPFVAINCAAMAPELVESELFGHVRGAFTGASTRRAGRFQTAHGGTLLLDEIGELSSDVQAKLLRVLQEGVYSPVGSDDELRTDVRILAATNVDLVSAAAEGRFRSDLLYRLNVFPLQLPPLRERSEDFAMIVDVLLTDLCRRTGRPLAQVSADGVEHLRRYDWPGNLRELANVLERGLILSRERVLQPARLDLPRRTSGMSVGDSAVQPFEAETWEPATLDEVQRRHIERVLRSTSGKIYGEDGAARILGLKPTTLQSRMKKLGVQRD